MAEHLGWNLSGFSSAWLTMKSKPKPKSYYWNNQDKPVTLLWGTALRTRLTQVAHTHTHKQTHGQGQWQREEESVLHSGPNRKKHDEKKEQWLDLAGPVFMAEWTQALWAVLTICTILRGKHFSVCPDKQFPASQFTQHIPSSSSKSPPVFLPIFPSCLLGFPWICIPPMVLYPSASVSEYHSFFPVKSSFFQKLGNCPKWTNGS